MPKGLRGFQKGNKCSKLRKIRGCGIWTNEQREAQGKRMRGNTYVNLRNNYNHSVETIQKIITGIRKHYNEIGRKTPENERIRKSIEYRLWREAVFARDNYTCQKYGIKGGKLHPHHIQNFAQYPELRFAIDNGVTLSDKAHREFHKKYGQRNNTKEQLREFSKNSINKYLKNYVHRTKNTNK